MPITFTKSYQCSDGNVFAQASSAQIHELKLLLKVPPTDDARTEFLSEIVQNADAVVNILTTSGKSRPAARKANGAVRRPRKITSVKTDASTPTLPNV